MTALTRLIASTPFRLTVGYLGAFVVAVGLIVGYVAWRANELLTSRVIETLSVEIAGLREQLQAGGPERLKAAIEERSAEPGPSLYLLIAADGRKLAGNLATMPAELASGSGGHLFRYARALEAAPAPRRMAVGVALPVPGGLTAVVGRDIEDQRRFASTIGQLALWGVGLLSVLGVAAGVLISRSMLARIETVTEASRKIMAGDLSRRIPLNGSGDELDRLSENLNGMLTRIEELMGALREVSDNIAHDLRTPLTRLRNRAEAALRDEGGGSYRDGLVKTIEEADDLIKTFDSLLLIARLEGGAVGESMSVIDPAAIIADVAELYEPVAEEGGLRLLVSAPQSGRVLANRELISQAVANLVDNAIKYSAAEGAAARADAPSGQTVEIMLQRAGSGIEISVADRGPGVPEQDRSRALQRFVRLEKSRSRPGSGLGLSLVAAVARLHGGAIRLEDNAPGLKAVLTLPTHLADEAPVVGTAPAREPAAGPAATLVKT